MRAAVLAAFPEFTTKFEGRLNFMYLDALGLVTTGVGNLIDPVGAALALPWVHSDNSPASAAEITEEWNKIKGLSSLDQRGGAVYGSYTSLHLTDDAIDSLVQSKLQANEAELQRYFPDWDNWPADAQMGALSMAWAMGAGFPETFKNFVAAANTGDWMTAATQSQMAPTPGIAPRNAADLLLFQNAAVANANPETLYYPNQAWADAVPTLDPAAVDVPSILDSVAGTTGKTLLTLTVLAIVGVGGWLSYSLLRGT